MVRCRLGPTQAPPPSFAAEAVHKFDPQTGKPIRFDPYTGQPVNAESTEHAAADAHTSSHP